MNQSTSFAQVATNLLNVLQGYTKGIRFVAVLTVLLTIGVGSMWGATTTYTFTSEKWVDSSNGWTSGKDGVAYLNSGVQVTEKGTGAYATSNTSFTNISKIDVKYCTNASKGAGTIVLTVGSTSKTLTVSKIGGTTMRTISASFDPNVSGTIKITVNCTTNSIYIGGITITTVENAKPHTVTLNAGPGTCAAFVTETSAGDGVTLPEPTLDCGNWKFAGWATSPVEEEITKAPKFITDKPYKPSGNITLHAVYQRTETIEGVETTTTTTDILTRETTGVTDGSTTYSTWSNKTVTSPAVYAGNSAGSNNSIQLRSNNSNSGIITTTSGGKAKKVTVVWQSSTANGRTLDIYGKKSAYSAATDLYSTSTQGTKLGSIVNGTSTTLTITDDYEYIGLRSNSNAMYLTSISIDWATSTGGGTSSTTYYHSTPECSTETSIYLYPNFGSELPTITTTGATTYTVPACSFTRDGYTFSHWNTNADGTGTNYNPGVTINLDGTDVNLYAIWTPIEYQITYEGLGGASNDDNPTIYTIESETITFEEPGDRAGYIFKRWEPATIEKGSTGPVTVTANWCELLGDATELAVDLNFINEEDGETYVKFSWTPANNTKDHATKQVICIGKVGEEKKCTDLEGNQVWSGDLRSKLTPGEYKWTIQAIGNGETYCDGEVISGPNFTIEEPLTDNCRWVEIALEDITPEDEIVVTMGNDKIGYALGTEKITNSPKSQAITITSGMIDINQDFDYSKYTWSISAVSGGYTLQPYGTPDIYLYGVKSYISIGNNNTNNVFTIFTSPENGNKCFMYTIEYTPYYLGHGTEDGQTAWTRQKSYNFLLNSNTLKFYKKTCLPANKFWIDYELANVTCTSEKPAFVGADTEIELSFSAYTGYKLPEQVSITMGGNTLPEEAFAWEAEEGILYIVPKDGITGDIVITVEGCELLAIPTNLKANNITSSSATLSWDKIDHATEYQVHITDDDDSTEDIITTTSNTYYEVTGLSSASEYLWGVTPIASGYCGLTQEAEIFTTLDVYTVTFNTNGGTAVEPQNIDHGGKAAKPTDPTKTGYKFVGWYTEADTEFNFNTPIESATTLYAKWTANQYTITLRQQWGSGGTETVTVHFNNNDFSVSPIIVPTRNGYTFGGYYTAESGAGSQIIDASGAWLNVSTYIEGGKWVYANNLTLYAKWTQNFTITWLANGQPYHTQTAMMGTTVVKPENPNANELACDDKVFVGWVDKAISGSTNDEPTFVTDFGTIQANKTYYAVFAKLTGTLSNDYNKITDINDLTDGEYVIAYSYNGGTQVVLKNITEDAKYMNASALAPSSNKYTSPSAEYIWQLQKQDDGSYYIYNSSVNKFLYATTSALQLSDNPTKYTISYDNNYSHWKIKLSDNTSYYMHGYVSGSSYDFRVSTSGSGNNYRVYLYKNASTAVYSEYVTTCVEIPEPVWNGAEISHSNIKVNCGEYTTLNAADPNNGPATISFPVENNLDLTYPITLTVTEGNFLLSTNKTDYSKYTTSVEVAPNKTGDNVGKITQNVYVIAIAPAGSGGDFTGTITISGQQIATQTITVTAEVSCTQYTLTFNDQGQTKTVEGFAGTSVVAPEPWAGICTEPIQYVFDGWAETPVANGTEEYEKINFSTYTMPGNNTTVYAVYRYAEEGGEPVDGFVKVTEALSDWTGDYVIVNETAKKAIGNEYAYTNTLIAVDVEITDNHQVHSPTNNIIWQIRKHGEYYTMYNESARKYAYVDRDKTEGAGLSSTITGTTQDVQIIFNSGTAKVSGVGYYRCFYYNSDKIEWRTYASGSYNTGALYRLFEKTLRYTSSLICGEISVEEDNVVVTSTKDQKVKVNVPIKVSSYYNDVVNVTGVGESTFSVAAIENVAVNTDETVNLELTYSPSEYDHLDNETITLTASNGATTTFQVKGRSLPEKFAVVAKVGNNWFALPSQGLNSETTPIGYPIAVDNNEEPTEVTSLPTTAEWSLRNVHKVNGSTDRFADNGENLVFVNAENKTLYANNGNANIQTFAEYTNYAENNPERYEWVPTTTDLTNYTLKNVGRDNDLSINVNATFGTHASNIASNNLRFLPINATYNPFDMQVVEWYPTKVLVQTEATLASVSATVGGVAVANPGVTKKGGKLYEISGLPLESNPTKILTISYDSYSCSKVIPIIISQDTKTVSDAPFSTLTKAIYNYSDLVVRDGAVLNITGAKNTPDKFVNVTIYPTAKIVVPENNQLSVYSLTFFGGIDDIYDGEKYTTNKYGVPQLSLKGTLGKTVTTMDYIMRVNLDQMYQVGVPYDVNLNEITYWDGSAIKLGDELYVSAYDGQARANREKKTWIYETDFETKLGAATLKAGVGYTISAEPQNSDDTYSILRMPMTKNISSGDTEGEKKVNVVAYDNQKGVTITENHKGWNYLSNPYMTTISGGEADTKLVLGYLKETGTGPWEWVETTQRYVTIPMDNGKDYYQKKFSEAELKPFKSFFLQIAENGDLSFALASRQNAPARLLQQQTTSSEVEFELLLSNGKQSDNTGLLISEEYTPAYEINADLEKMTGAMSVYTIYNGYNLAYNALSPLNAEEQIPVGYIVPAKGEYTFALDPNSDLDAFKHIYLMDYKMGVTTDLIYDAYTFYTADTKSDKRFAIHIELFSDSENKPTGFEDVGLDSEQPYKFMYRGILYIMHNGVIYTTTGQQLNTMDK